MAVVDIPHLVCIPYPAQSHIGAMMKLAKLLHHKGFYITFVNTEHNHNRILRARGNSSLDGLANFQFQTIPDGLPPSDANGTQNMLALLLSLRENALAPLLILIGKINGKSGVPPVSCILSDGFMTPAVQASRQLEIPVVVYWTISACSLMGFYQYPALLQKSLTPLKDKSYLSNGYLDTVIDWIPGMKDIRLKDLPSGIRTTDPNDIPFKFCMEAMEGSTKASANIIHTFDALESVVLDSLGTLLPCLYAMGPLQLLLSQISDQEEEEEGSKSIGFSLWKEELKCLEWLDSKEPGSVIYVNFGSLAHITSQQLIEIGMGLSDSNCNFLWIIRPDLVTGESAVLPPNFEMETKERGLVVSWCPQEKVLNHPSVGGFLTHCGWSSILESLSAGVPMICWPFFGDQQTNCRFIWSEWMVGIEMDDDDVKRDKVEKLVRQLMEGDEGVKLKEKAMEWKKWSEEATRGPNGSSCLAFDNLVNKLKFLSFGGSLG